MNATRPLALAAAVFSYRSPGRRMILRVGKATLLAEIAIGAEATAKGLSGRRSIADGEGMLFVMPNADRLAFWMRGTSTPLSIAFIAEDGTILEIKDMQPHSEETVRSTNPVRLALEAPQGWFKRHGVGVGSVVAVAS